MELLQICMFLLSTLLYVAGTEIIDVSNTTCDCQGLQKDLRIGYGVLSNECAFSSNSSNYTAYMLHLLKSNITSECLDGKRTTTDSADPCNNCTFLNCILPWFIVSLFILYHLYHIIDYMRGAPCQGVSTGNGFITMVQSFCSRYLKSWQTECPDDEGGSVNGNRFEEQLRVVYSDSIGPLEVQNSTVRHRGRINPKSVWDDIASASVAVEHEPADKPVENSPESTSDKSHNSSGDFGRGSSSRKRSMKHRRLPEGMTCEREIVKKRPEDSQESRAKESSDSSDSENYSLSDDESDDDKLTGSSQRCRLLSEVRDSTEAGTSAVPSTPSLSGGRTCVRDIAKETSEDSQESHENESSDNSDSEMYRASDDESDGDTPIGNSQRPRPLSEVRDSTDAGTSAEPSTPSLSEGMTCVRNIAKETSEDSQESHANESSDNSDSEMYRASDDESDGDTPIGSSQRPRPLSEVGDSTEAGTSAERSMKHSSLSEGMTSEREIAKKSPEDSQESHESDDDKAAESSQKSRPLTEDRDSTEAGTSGEPSTWSREQSMKHRSLSERMTSEREIAKNTPEGSQESRANESSDSDSLDSKINRSSDDEADDDKPESTEARTSIVCNDLFSFKTIRCIVTAVEPPEPVGSWESITKEFPSRELELPSPTVYKMGADVRSNISLDLLDDLLEFDELWDPFQKPFFSPLFRGSPIEGEIYSHEPLITDIIKMASYNNKMLLSRLKSKYHPSSSASSQETGVNYWGVVLCDKKTFKYPIDDIALIEKTKTTRNVQLKSLEKEVCLKLRCESVQSTPPEGGTSTETRLAISQRPPSYIYQYYGNIMIDLLYADEAFIGPMVKIFDLHQPRLYKVLNRKYYRIAERCRYALERSLQEKKHD